MAGLRGGWIFSGGPGKRESKRDLNSGIVSLPGLWGQVDRMPARPAGLIMCIVYHEHFLE